MRLRNFATFNEIVIQMHDNPDADALASGYGLYKYFKSMNREVRLIYGGFASISKASLVLMINELEIPAEHVQTLPPPELLITVDCQHGEGNVTHFDAQNIGIVDHHDTGTLSNDMFEIHSEYTSCATLVYALLLSERYPVNSDIKLATALYYGLYIDSNGLTETRHLLDKFMVDDLDIDSGLIRRFRYSNYTLDEMKIAGSALTDYFYDEKHRYAIIKAHKCDPGILGIIADFALQVDTVDVCLIYCRWNNGYKLSVRSCIDGVQANELTTHLTKDIGTGGGNVDKAGGVINFLLFEKRYPNTDIAAYLYHRMNLFFDAKS